MIILRHMTWCPSYRHKTFPTQISRKLLIGREGVLFWTTLAVTQNYTYPEQTPRRPSIDHMRRDRGRDRQGLGRAHVGTHGLTVVWQRYGQTPCTVSGALMFLFQ